jgi:hypothetical protein
MSAPILRRAVLLAAIGIAGLGAWRLLAPSAAPTDDPQLLLDRPWFDSKPDKYTDYVHAFYASKYGQTSVFQKASAYDFHFELATFRRDGNKLALTFPQTGKSADITFTIRACSDLPPFDLCLELSDNPWGGPKRYHATRQQDDESSQLGKAAKVLRLQAGE